MTVGGQTMDDQPAAEGGEPERPTRRLAREIIKKVLATLRRLVCISGTIGAGKSSTIGQLIYELTILGYDVLFLAENRNEEIFKEYLADRKRNANRFQHAMLCGRVQQAVLAAIWIEKSLREGKNPIVLWERSHLDDEVFYLSNVRDGTINLKETRAAYYAISDWATETTKDIMMFVYIHAPIETAIYRLVHHRNREGEAAAYASGTSAYYLDLYARYEEWTAAIEKNYPLIRFDNGAHEESMRHSAEELDARTSTESWLALSSSGSA